MAAKKKITLTPAQLAKLNAVEQSTVKGLLGGSDLSSSQQSKLDNLLKKAGYGVEAAKPVLTAEQKRVQNEQAKAAEAARTKEAQRAVQAATVAAADPRAKAITQPEAGKLQAPSYTVEGILAQQGRDSTGKFVGFDKAEAAQQRRTEAETAQHKMDADVLAEAGKVTPLDYEIERLQRTADTTGQMKVDSAYGSQAAATLPVLQRAEEGGATTVGPSMTAVGEAKAAEAARQAAQQAASAAQPRSPYAHGGLRYAGSATGRNSTPYTDPARWAMTPVVITKPADLGYMPDWLSDVMIGGLSTLALGGILSPVTGAITSGLPGVAGNIASNALTGAAQSAIMGGDPLEGALSGGLGGAIGDVGGDLFDEVLGGTDVSFEFPETGDISGDLMLTSAEVPSGALSEALTGPATSGPGLRLPAAGAPSGVGLRLPEVSSLGQAATSVAPAATTAAQAATSGSTLLQDLMKGAGGAIPAAAMGGLTNAAIAGVLGGDVGKAALSGALGGGLGSIGKNVINPEVAKALNVSPQIANILTSSGVNALSAALLGGNVGQAALGGALGGAGSAVGGYLGGQLPGGSLSATLGLPQWATDALVKAGLGGVLAEIAGKDFTTGALVGGGGSLIGSGIGALGDALSGPAEQPLGTGLKVPTTYDPNLTLDQIRAEGLGAGMDLGGQGLRTDVAAGGPGLKVDLGDGTWMTDQGIVGDIASTFVPETKFPSLLTDPTLRVPSYLGEGLDMGGEGLKPGTGELGLKLDVPSGTGGQGLYVKLPDGTFVTEQGVVPSLADTALMPDFPSLTPFDPTLGRAGGQIGSALANSLTQPLPPGQSIPGVSTPTPNFLDILARLLGGGTGTGTGGTATAGRGGGYKIGMGTPTAPQRTPYTRLSTPANSLDVYARGMMANPAQMLLDLAQLKPAEGQQPQVFASPGLYTEWV